MRSALRYSLAIAVFAVSPSSIAGAVGCGPSELFIGTVLVEGSRDGLPDADLDGEALNVILDAAAPLCEHQLGGRDASTLLRQLGEDACRNCALGSCCVAVTRCLLSEMNATTPACAMHARCTSDCYRGGSDASADAGEKHCLAACKRDGTPKDYTDMKSCLEAAACSCAPL